MLIFFGKKATKWKGLVRQLETLTLSLLSELTTIANHIASGSKLRQVTTSILKVVDGDGNVHHYRLTISLDSLAGQETTDVGTSKTATANPSGETNEKA